MPKLIHENINLTKMSFGENSDHFEDKHESPMMDQLNPTYCPENSFLFTLGE